MALTMTRTRTQTALTKLAQLLADVNGELAFIDEIVPQPLIPIREADSARLRLRREQLDKSRAALCTTIRQFDPSIDPDTIGTARDWLHTRARTARSRQRVYLSTLRSTRDDEGETARLTPVNAAVWASTLSVAPVQLPVALRR